MAEKAESESEFVIQIEDPATREKKYVRLSPQMVEALNSSDQLIRHHAFELISKTWEATPDDCSEPAADTSCVPESVECCDNVTEDDYEGTMSEASEKSNTWSKSATLLLINEMTVRKEQLDKGLTTKKRVFQDISKVMFEHSYKFTADQISGRWKTLQRGYKNVKDHNRSSGSGKKTYEYEIVLDEYFGKDPIVTPVKTLTSGNGSASVGCSTSSEENGEEQIQLRKKRKSASGEMVDVMKSYIEAQEERHKEEVNRKDKMHQERLALISKLIDVVSKKQ